MDIVNHLKHNPAKQLISVYLLICYNYNSTKGIVYMKKKKFSLHIVLCFLLVSCVNGNSDISSGDSAIYKNVVFKDYDNTILAETTFAVGHPIVYPGTNPSREGISELTFEFLGWDDNGDFEVDDLPTVGANQDYVFKAVYEYRIDTVATDYHFGAFSSSNFTIESSTNGYVIDLSTVSGRQIFGTKIMATESLNSLYIIGNRVNDRAQFIENLSFVIGSRTSSFDIHFHSFAFRAFDFDSAISCLSSINLNVTFGGAYNEIHGAKGLDGQSGLPAISATQLFVYGTSASIYGGTGGDGVAASNSAGNVGGTGGYALSSNSLTLNVSALMMRAGNGGEGSRGSDGAAASNNSENGHDGFRGGNGGRGGVVINATSIINNCPNLTLVAGDGGDGGDGGNGGAGAIGRRGTMELSQYVTDSNRSQPGTTGGRGGDGGDGGESGSYFSVPDSISGLNNYLTTPGNLGDGGDGGNGGTGGKGADGAPDEGVYFVYEPFNLDGANGGSGGAGGNGGNGRVGGQKGIGGNGGEGGKGTSKNFGVFGGYPKTGNNGLTGPKGADGLDGLSLG